MSVNYRQCYELLNLDAKADWEALRKSYRHLVQQCHPDRYEQDPEARAKAEARLRALNHAYKELVDYYKSHNHLPFAKVVVKNHDNWRFQNTSGLEAREEEHEAALGRSAFSVPVPVWIILGVIPLGVILLLIIFLLSQLKEEGVEPEDVADARQLAPAGAVNPRSVEKKPPSFQYGDSQDYVLQVQGKPTRKLDNVWFYGESSVRFQQGYVVGWNIEKGFPLRVSGAMPNERRRFFDVGASMEEVLSIQGEPIMKTRFRWDYGASFVEFEKGRVVGWYSSVLRPLAVPPESNDGNN
ncbi:J domain-containing protein [Thiolapillus sp.]